MSFEGRVGNVAEGKEKKEGKVVGSDRFRRMAEEAETVDVRWRRWLW